MTTENTSSIVTPSRIRRIRKCVETIECYGHFREGQDGFQALLELRQFVDELEGKLSPYGYCPHCSESIYKSLNHNQTPARRMNTIVGPIEAVSIVGCLSNMRPSLETRL